MFRWLGAAGFELQSSGSILTVDPFVTRPPLRNIWFGRPRSRAELVERYVPVCDHVLVTHTHYDHVMDVPAVVRHTGATAYVPPNSRPLLRAHGIATRQIRVIEAGDELDLGAFEVKVYAAEHIRLPGLDPGAMALNLDPPLRLRDYRMDVCLSLLIHAGGLNLLRGSVRSGPEVSADVLFIGAEGSPPQYERLLRCMRSPVIIPVHWDDFFRPLSQPIRPRFGPALGKGLVPRRISLARFQAAVEQAAPLATVVFPEPLRTYDLTRLAATARSA